MQMSVRKIIQTNISGGSKADDDGLHIKADAVIIIDDSIQILLRDLFDTMNAYPICRGLSAPQIGENVAISVVTINKNEQNRSFALINPRVVSTSGSKNRKRESCMSVWGYMGEVERRYKAMIEYQDENNELHVEEFHGFDARVIMHEIDHLNGIVYTDYFDDYNSIQETDLFDGMVIIDDGLAVDKQN
jgi:peptide deformylase